jgi:hypothetical protein
VADALAAHAGFCFCMNGSSVEKTDKLTTQSQIKKTT